MPKVPATCYKCNSPATSKEHFPPRCFFPRGPNLNLQLKTVPACELHNNAKSGDDQFLLAHICLNASKGPGLPREIFNRSISPQLDRSQGFHASLATGAKHFKDGTAAFQVDLLRFDCFFSHLCWAIFFDRYGVAFNDSTHVINHIYFSLSTKEPHEIALRKMLNEMLKVFRDDFEAHIERYEAAKAAESVYANQIIDPARHHGSITIVHTFYGIFEVVSMLSRREHALDA